MDSSSPVLKRIDTLFVNLHTLFIFLLPLFFLPTTQDWFEWNKFALLIGITLFTLFLYSIKTLFVGRLLITWSQTAKIFGLLVLITLPSFVLSVNKVQALLTPFGFSSILCFFVLSLITPPFTSRYKTQLRLSFVVSAALIGIIAMYQFFKLGSIFFPTLTAVSDQLWSPTGSVFATLALLLPALAIAVDWTLLSLKEKKDSNIILGSTAVVVISCGLILTCVALVPKFATTRLPYTAGWTMAMEGLKNPRYALIGTGAENVTSVITLGKPVWLNATALWNTHFRQNATFLLHLVTAFGIFVLIPFLLIAQRAFHTRSPGHTAAYISVLLLLCLLPPSFVLLYVLWFIVEQEHTHSTVIHINADTHPAARAGIIAAILGCIGFVTYGIGRAYIAERTFYQALLATQAGNGTDSYNSHIKAIQYNPANPRFHANFSVINLAIATNLTNTANQEQRDLDDKDRELVAQLIQQAIREAKLAVNMAPEDIVMWENLARTYQSIIGFADGADNWAIAAYQKAIQLDPSNPLLRMDLGALHVRKQEYDQAIVLFSAATTLKPDYANGYYNLANAYKRLGKLDLARQALEQTLRLVPADSSDYTKTNNELTELKKTQENKEQEATQPTPDTESSQLTQPATESATLNPPLTLPEDQGILQPE